MYEEFLGLNSSPFQLSPDPFFMIPSERSQEALASIFDAIRLRKGFVVMTGEVGTGKTLVLRCLIERLEREEISFAYFIGPRLSTVDFLSYIAFELGLNVPEPTKGNLLRALYVFLLSQFEKGLTTVLIIDEAHQMPRSVLEEIRLLTNFETAQQKLVQIVLVGQPELDKKLDLVELRSLKQRIAVRCHLEPLRAEDVRHYIERRLELAGAGSQAATLFPPESVKAIYRYSQGIPRLVNSICDQALATACAWQIRVVPAEVIKAVASHFRLEPGAHLNPTEKPFSVASPSESLASDMSRPAAAASGLPDVSSREPEVAATHLGESAGMSLQAPLSSIPETPHDGGLRDVLVLAPRENKLEKEPIIARAAHSHMVAHIAAPARESALAVGSAIRPDRPAQSTVFQHQNPLSLRRSIQPDEELRDAGPSQIRRWLKPGLRLTLIIGAAAVVPAALAMGVYMARHQKTVVVVPSPVGPKGSFLVERAITPAPPVAASPAVDVARSPKEVIVSQTGSGRSIPPAAPVRLAPHATVAFSALAKPTPKLSPRSASVEPPPIVGTQTKDPDIGKAFLGNSVPSPTPPAVIIASNPPPSLGAPTKERGPGTGLPGSTSLVANIPSHLEPPRLVSSPPPNYPTVARSSPVGGYVLIDAVVDETGKVADMKVISGNSVLTSAATEALRKWKYEPARLNGQPTSAHVRVRMDFSPH